MPVHLSNGGTSMHNDLSNDMEYTELTTVSDIWQIIITILLWLFVLKVAHIVTLKKMWKVREERFTKNLFNV